MTTAKELADAIRMALGLHSCPPEDRFCWRCEALKTLEPILDKAQDVPQEKKETD